VEETVDLEHSGAKLKGLFSRFDFQRSQAPAAITTLRQVLPFGADDVYYRDEIGNISTSHLSVSQGKPTLELIPRYPLFGGWKASFYTGYNLPAQYYLFNDVNDGSVYMLNTTFATSFDDVVIDTLIVRITFPEGTKNIEHFAHVELDGVSTSLLYSYLDTTGRPVLILEKKNVVAEHNRFFQVTYNFSQLSMFQEPLLLVTSYFAFFLFIMLYVRMDFQVGETRRIRSPHSEKVADLLVRMKDIMDQRAELHSGLDVVLSKLSKGKNKEQYDAERKISDSGFAAFRKEMAKLIIEIDEVDADTAKKVRSIELKEEKKNYNQLQLHENELNYRIKKTIPKSAYEESKTEFEKFYKSVDDEIETVVSDLTEGL